VASTSDPAASGHLEYLRQSHGTRGRVEFCGGFVGDEQPGLDRERPGQGAAGRGRRVWRGKARGAERDLDVFGSGQQ
jgi:hypothetical protein